MIFYFYFYCSIINLVFFLTTLFFITIIRDAGPKCPVDNERLSESQVCISILNYCCHDISAVNGYLVQKFGPCILWLAKVALAVDMTYQKLIDSLIDGWSEGIP